LGSRRHPLGSAALIVGAVAVVAAAPLRGQDTATALLRDVRFASGETLPELRMHYLTMGHPRRDAAGAVSNAVLLLHGTTGSGRQFLNPLFADEMFRVGQPLDTAVFFVVAPDNVGHGRSSKPSDGMRARFPRYAYDDMVDAQRRLLQEALGVDHLLLVLGTSMGCMHAWLWGERYPGAMDGLVPLACAPAQIAGRNRMLRRMILDDIRNDPDWAGGDYVRQPRGLAAALQVVYLMGSAPLVQQRDAPTRDAADSLWERWLAAALPRYDANDVAYAFDASRDYDPSARLGNVRAPVLFINSADDLINPPELGIAERLIARVPHGRFVLVPTSDRTRGHGTHTAAAVWKPWVAPFIARLARARGLLP
jgi:homoserine O-acetyltransferase/O-succinyltransferase